jgi:hypothetical protein
VCFVKIFINQGARTIRFGSYHAVIKFFVRL